MLANHQSSQTDFPKAGVDQSCETDFAKAGVDQACQTDFPDVSFFRSMNEENITTSAELSDLNFSVYNINN